VGILLVHGTSHAKQPPKASLPQFRTIAPMSRAHFNRRVHDTGTLSPVPPVHSLPRHRHPIPMHMTNLLLPHVRANPPLHFTSTRSSPQASPPLQPSNFRHAQLPRYPLPVILRYALTNPNPGTALSSLRINQIPSPIPPIPLSSHPPEQP
jgi:hypothetical protein